MKWFYLTIIAVLGSCKGIYKDPNTIKLLLDHDGLERKSLVHLPSGYDDNETYPLVIFLHGAKGDIERYAKRLNWIDKSDENGFILVFPQGEHRYWDDARGTTKASEENVDDIGFIDALIDKIINDYNADENRIFITGVSNGGFMTYRIGCELSEKVTAIAPVVATLPEKQTCTPAEQTPILFILGTKDPYIPYEGGEMEKGAGGNILSADETFAAWVNINGCGSETEIVALEDQHDDETTVSVITALGCDSLTSVIQYKIVGGGHEWQGAKAPSTGNNGDGHRCEEIDATDVVWDFFSKY